MEKIEISMHEDPSKMIDERRAVDEVSAHVDEIDLPTDGKGSRVTPQFPLIARIVITSVATTIVAGTYYNSNRRKE